MNKSSSSSTDIDDADEGEVKTLEETFLDMDQRRSYSHSNRRSAAASHRTDLGTPMIQELLQSNMDLKYRRSMAKSTKFDVFPSF